MVTLEKPAKRWVRQLVGEQLFEDMNDVVKEQTGEDIWEVLETGYTNEDYERDIEYHDNRMQVLANKFEKLNDVRLDVLEDSRQVTGLKAMRKRVKAKKIGEDVWKLVTKFVAHMKKYLKKMNELTAVELRRIEQDMDTVVDLGETAEAVNEGLNNEVPDTESEERLMADKAVEHEHQKHSMDDILQDEEELIEMAEEEGVPVNELSGSESEVESFLEEELGEDYGFVEEQR